MLFTFLFFLQERIRSPIGESTHIPFVTSSNITGFLNRYPLSVIFFHDLNVRFDFANFGIYKFSQKIAFARASNNETIGNCKEQLCVVPFRGTRRIKLQNPPEIAIEFAKWCKRVSKMNEVVVVKTPEDLKEAFQQDGNCLFGVNMKAKPEFIKNNDLQFYLVQDTMFDYFNIKVDSGLYLYRYVDRQLIKTDKNYLKYLKSPLTDINEINLKEKRYFGGFFINNNHNETNEQINLLTKLAQRYNDKISFSIIYGDIMDEIKKESKLNYVKNPFFCIFDSNNLSRRWIVLDSNNYKSMNYLENLIQRILSGEEKPDLLSSEKLFNHSVTFNEFQDKIAENGDKLILYYSQTSQKRIRVLFETIFKYIHIDNFKFYSYDTDKNEIPDDFDSTPSVILYPEGKMKVPYEDLFDPALIVKFLKEEGYAISFSNDYDPSKIKKEVNTILYPKLFQHQKNYSKELSYNEL